MPNDSQLPGPFLIPPDLLFPNPFFTCSTCQNSDKMYRIFQSNYLILIYLFLSKIFVATYDISAAYLHSQTFSKKINNFSMVKFGTQDANMQRTCLATKHTVRRPWLHPCQLLHPAAPYLHKKHLHGIAPCGGLFTQRAPPALAFFTSPAPDQPGPASPDCIGYASLERGQRRPRSLLIRL